MSPSRGRLEARMATVEEQRRMRGLTFTYRCHAMRRVPGVTRQEKLHGGAWEQCGKKQRDGKHTCYWHRHLEGTT